MFPRVQKVLKQKQSNILIMELIRQKNWDYEVLRLT
jgi:hypothetical protein